MMERISTSQQTPAIDRPGPSEPSFVEALVNPAGVFRDPEEVVHHPWFTHEEKRTILLSWVRDELVIEQVARQALSELRPESRIDASSRRWRSSTRGLPANTAPPRHRSGRITWARRSDANTSL